MQIFDLVNINTVLTPVPSSFNNGLSLYEDISKLIYLLNELIKNVNGNTNEEVELKKEYEKNLVELKSIKEQFEKYVSGDTIPDGSISFKKLNNTIFNQINDYIKSYMYDMHKFVTFGITESGYFYADIPDTWKDITFNTNPQGNLILEY